VFEQTMRDNPLAHSGDTIRNTARLMDLRRAQFEYEPYPIGIIRNVFDSSLYRRLVESFPAVELFRFMQTHGDKWSLSELNNRDNYHQFLRSNSDWRRVYDEVKSSDFIARILGILIQSKIDLGLIPAAGSNAIRMLRNKVLGRGLGGLRARFEFSMMSAAGGHILPHTDSPQKKITLVMSMVQPGEWDQNWGGGTDRMRPLDPSENFNFLNRYLRFDQVETIGSMAYEPNQCVIFIKTFNSLHGVRPMQGPREIMRRTLTVNIESV
jgi:hypothetical protein